MQSVIRAANNERGADAWRGLLEGELDTWANPFLTVTRCGIAPKAIETRVDGCGKDRAVVRPATAFAGDCVGMCANFRAGESVKYGEFDRRPR
jgi:hypothetical protein